MNTLCLSSLRSVLYQAPTRFAGKVVKRRTDPSSCQRKSTTAGSSPCCAVAGSVDRKATHGIFLHQTSKREEYDTEGSFAWLTYRQFQAQTAGLVIMAQDGVILTRRYMKEVMHITVDNTRPSCRKGVVTIGHVLSSCECHRWTLLKERHDRVVYQLMMGLAKRLNMTVTHSMTWSLAGCS